MPDTPSRTILLGESILQRRATDISGEYVAMLGDVFYRIRNFDAMEPFFMSIVSSSDHWLFISSTGGLSAGRVSAERALFPYYTEDKLAENSEHTGNKAILLVSRAGQTSLWEPFSQRHNGLYRIERNVYKNTAGTAVVFEEINLSLGLTYRYAWRTSDAFGFVKTTWLVNAQEPACHVELVDGLQNILPANVSMATQNTFSNLLDAYKRSELHPDTGLALFSLSSTLTDLAEPSESLVATTVAQIGLPNPRYLLSSAQLDRFRIGEPIETETDVRGRRGAYFVHATVDLDGHGERSWHVMADVHQDGAATARAINRLQGDRASLMREVEADIARGRLNLWKTVASADGLELSQDPSRSAHHFPNVMFNVMRGGVFVDQYWIKAGDFAEFAAARNRAVVRANSGFFAELPARIHVTELLARARATGSADVIRLSYAYLPLIFSRRHGDPSRPWNRFSINLKNPDGSVKIDYEGNWRDIFQNWEALAYSYPEYVESMIATFLNATTVDGYNPYRVTHHGVDWEVPEPSNPWANIGYWSDHQIIYLQKLMEISARMHPGRLTDLLARPVFSHAHVPYRIKPYADLLKDPHNTIDFDWKLERHIEARVHEIGADGKLVHAADGSVRHVSLAEKLLALLLAKLANFVPEGGIWMNTQRPEWNDANNALVGKGLSVVTLCYLRRYIAFVKSMLGAGAPPTVPLSVEVHAMCVRVSEVLKQFQPILGGSFNDVQRRLMMDALGEAGSGFRGAFYADGLSGDLAHAPSPDIIAFLDLAQDFVEHSLRANKRADDLYHSYNILRIEDGRASIGRLYEMLEGQVAVLSSGMLTADESLALLASLRNSRLYVADQHSYLLYPDRDLPGFMQKNCLSGDQVRGVPLLAALAQAKEVSVIVEDVNGAFHFSGHVRNFQDVHRSLARLKSDPRFATLVEADYGAVKALFEGTFHHDEFTGRSGTFFAYEGLGSIYWHMVAKLLLAVQETAFRFRREPAARALAEKYVDIRLGLGFNKSPRDFGAFPADPYSHTPKGQGAKQPGMTGLVKEEILARQAELGFAVSDGRIAFEGLLLDPREFLDAPASFAYLDVSGEHRQLALNPGSLAYTVCQTPIVVATGDAPRITVHHADGTRREIDGSTLDETASWHIFLRDGFVDHLTVSFPPDAAALRSR